MMISSNSLVNKDLYDHTLKQYLLLSKVSMISFLSMLLISLALNDHGYALSIFVLLISCVILPTFYPMIIFNALHDTTKACHLRSMPLKTHTVFTTYLLVGLVLVLGPLLLEATLIIWLTEAEIKILFAILILALYYFLLALLANILSGTKKSALILTLVFFGLPGCLYVLLNIVSLHHAFGINYVSMNNQWLYFFMPLVSGIKFMGYESQWPHLLSHVIMILGLGVLDFYAMKYRHEEKIGDAFVFDKMSWVVRLGLLVTLSSSLYLVCASMIQETSYASYLFKLDTLYVASGCLCALVIELIFKQKLSLMPMMRWYLPCIAAMVFLMHFYGDVLSEAYLDDQKYSYVYMTINTPQDYRYADVNDKEAFKDLMKVIMKDYPYHLPSQEGVTLDMHLEKSDISYEFVLKEDDFQTLLSSSPLLKSVYYHQGLTYDTCVLADYMIITDEEGRYHVYFGERYRHLVNALKPIFDDENMDWVSSSTQETVVVSLYAQNTLLKEITSLDSHHPLVQTALSEAYDQPISNDLVNSAYAYMEKLDDLSSWIDQQDLRYQVIHVVPYIRDGKLLSVSDEEVTMLVPCGVAFSLDTGGEFEEYESIYVTFRLDDQQVIIDSVRFDEAFYRQYGKGGSLG